MKNSNIHFNLSLDANQVPEKIEWQADGQGQNGPSSTPAILVSIFDADSGETLRIDLWTKEMTTNDMLRMVHATINALADTVERATSDAETARGIREFAVDLGQRVKHVTGA